MPKEPYFYFMISLPLCFSCWISNNGQINSGKKEADRTLSTPPLHGSSGRQSINSHHSSGLLVSDLFSLSLSSCCCLVIPEVSNGSGCRLHALVVNTCLWVAVTWGHEIDTQSHAPSTPTSLLCSPPTLLGLHVTRPHKHICTALPWACLSSISVTVFSVPFPGVQSFTPREITLKSPFFF